MAKGKKGPNILLIVGIFFFIALIIGLIIWLVISLQSPKSPTTTGPPTTTTPPSGTTAPPGTTVPPSGTTTAPPTAPPPQNTPTGGNCSQLSACASGNFCNEDGICTQGVALTEGQACTGTQQCILGTICNANNICVASVTNGNVGQSCNSNANCNLGLICDSSTRVCKAPTTTTVAPGVTTPPPSVLCDSTQRIGVYRIYTARDRQLSDTTNPPVGSTFYPPQASPIWYGCTTSGPNRIPLYSWVKGRRDRVFSLSNRNPFEYTGHGYTLENSGNPMAYVYSSKVDNSVVPLIRLSGENQDEQKVYHTTSVQPPPIHHHDIVYNWDNQPNRDTSNLVTVNAGDSLAQRAKGNDALLGYVFIN